MEREIQGLEFNNMEEFFKHFFDKGNKILDLEERVAKSAEEAGMDVPDVSTKEFSDALVDYVWKNRSYQMDRYYTGRVLAAQLSASARVPVSEDNEKFDALYKMKADNFVRLGEVVEMVLALEKELFGGIDAAIDLSDAKEKGDAIDRRKFGVMV
jgi:outer membrane receptor for Fe3+-dicitrate